MANTANDSAAEGYKQASFSAQKVHGETFIQTDVCPQTGDFILDLGCGTGELSAYLAGLVGPEGKVIGVDPDKERIQLAQQSHSQIKNLSFVEGSASNCFEIYSDVYNIVFCNAALHWMPDKEQLLKNIFRSLKVGGKVAINYIDHLPPFELDAYKEMNPENAERICQMYQCESKAKIERYCLSAGFDIMKSYETLSKELIFKNIESLLEFHWSATHGVFDTSLVTEERLQKYLAPYSSKDGTPCLAPYAGDDGKPKFVFRGMKHEFLVCRLIAVKQVI